MTDRSIAMTISLNGDGHEVPADASVADLLREVGLNPSAATGIAVAVNDEVVRKESWAERALAPGDRVEVITARQGG